MEETDGREVDRFANNLSSLSPYKGDGFRTRHDAVKLTVVDVARKCSVGAEANPQECAPHSCTSNGAGEIKPHALLPSALQEIYRRKCEGRDNLKGTVRVFDRDLCLRMPFRGFHAFCSA
jgi:hypothetical protein